jgi:hypothetical protein
VHHVIKCLRSKKNNSLYITEERLCGRGKKSKPTTRSCSTRSCSADMLLHVCMTNVNRQPETHYTFFFPQMKLAEKQPTFMKHLKPTDPSA